MSTATEYISALEEITAIFKTLDANKEIDPMNFSEIQEIMQQRVNTSSCPMRIGEKIKAIRTSRNIMVSQIAQSCNLTEASVRFYESGDRTPSPNTRDAIAQALDISPASIKDRQLNDINDCIHTLFDLEDTGIWDSEVFQGILAQWREKQQQLKSGAISFNEYRLWKMQFKAEK